MFKPPSKLFPLKGLPQSQVDNARRKRLLFPLQKAVLQWLLITSPLWGLIRPVVAAPPPPGTIDNTATGSFIDTATDNTVNIFSNTVTVTVVEVAGIAVSFDSAREATIVEAGANAGIYQGFDDINQGDLAYFDFVITNVGNDPTSFFIPAAPANVTGGTFNPAIPMQIIAVDPDGAGATLPTALSANVTGNNTIALLGATNGYIPPDGTVTVRVPVQVTETTIGNPISVILGNTTPPTSQNQTFSASGSNDDVYTVDLADGTATPTQAGYTGTTPETTGAPPSEKEASASGSVNLAAAYKIDGYKLIDAENFFASK